MLTFVPSAVVTFDVVAAGSAGAVAASLWEAIVLATVSLSAGVTGVAAAGVPAAAGTVSGAVAGAVTGAAGADSSGTTPAQIEII